LKAGFLKGIFFQWRVFMQVYCVRRLSYILLFSLFMSLSFSSILAAAQSETDGDSNQQVEKERKKNRRCRRCGRVRRLGLFNASTNKYVPGFKKIRNGSVIDLEKLPEGDLRLRAITSPRRVWKVEFEIEEQGDKSELSSLRALSGMRTSVTGRSVRKYLEWFFGEGTYRILVTPFRRKTSDPGDPLDATVVVTDGDSAVSEPDPDEEVVEAPEDQFPAGTRVWYVKDSTVHVNDVPIFPLGFYYVSYYPSQKSRRLNDLKKIAAAGFNMMHTPIDGEDQDLFDLANEHNVYIAAEFNGEPEHILPKFSGHPALALLGTFDDVDAYDDGVPRYSSSHVSDRSAQIKELAKNALTYISAGYPKRVEPFIGSSELLGFQTYPVPSEPISAVTKGYLGPVSDMLKSSDTGLIANLQSFGWYGQYRSPTRRELRNMTYQSLVVGSKGILYYTFYDSVTDLNQEPELWEELKDVADEIKELEPYLLKGSHKVLSTGNSRVFAARWTRGGKAVVAVVNGDANSTQSVSINLGLQGLNGLKNLFPERESGLQFSGDTLTGSIARERVHVYELNL
jgi:hypothetical protein